MKKLLVSVLALLAVTAAFAVPGLSSVNGGYALNSAKIIDTTVVGSMLFFDEDFDINNFHAIVPVGQYVEGMDALEASVELFFEDDLEAMFGAKYALPLEVEDVDLALGATYHTLGGATLYGAATYGFDTMPLDINLNLVYGFKAEEFSYGIGAEYDFDVAQAGIEFLSSDSSDEVNIYATADVYENFGVSLALSSIGKTNGDIISAGIKYTF